ncbi:hypothetical protein M0R45_005724 [Rubus argutus]|uniref:Uncharacterized protein n=1 Tax=Rubus argutus TaxID=59490 RepID=A0AAW1YNH3_RUBAR
MTKFQKNNLLLLVCLLLVLPTLVLAALPLPPVLYWPLCFIHVLPDAFENLTSPCLNEDPWGKFPFTGFVAMVAAIGTFMVDSIATSYFNRSQLKKAQNQTNGDEEKGWRAPGSR